MEECPKCYHMTAEKNHYTGKLVCYNRFCHKDSMEIKATCKKCKHPHCQFSSGVKYVNKKG
jgi:hypothetical protein